MMFRIIIGTSITRLMLSKTLFKHAATIAIIRYAQKLGIPQAELQKLISQDLRESDSSTLKVMPNQLLRLIDIIDRRFNIQIGGFDIIKNSYFSDLGITAYVLMNCKTIAELMQKIVTYQQLTGNVTRLSVELQEDLAAYRWEPNKKFPQKLEQIVLEFLVAVAIKQNPKFTGVKLPVERIEFNWPKPVDLSRYTAIKDEKILFDQPWTAIYFDRSYLDLPIETSNKELLPLFEAHAREYHEQLVGPQSMTGKVKEILSLNIHQANQIEQIAKSLTMSPRKLQYALGREGTTLMKLRNEIRFKYAIEMMQEKGMSVAEVSEQLGYSDISSFSRAFKRWSGNPPRFYTRNHIGRPKS